MEAENNEKEKKKLSSINLSQNPENRRIDFSKLDNLTKIKLLLSEIERRFDINGHIDMIYRAIQAKSYMYIYLFDVDLLITIIRPININDDNHVLSEEQRKLVVRVQKISAYGNYINSISFNNDEIQNFAKKLSLKLIESHYKELSELDKIIDKYTIICNRTDENIINTLMEEAVFKGNINKLNMIDYLKDFDKASKKDIVKKRTGRNPVFF